MSFEILVAIRYLRSKKRDAIVSVIAGFSFLGVALGVAALIVVMAVMNGFHQEISKKMIGFNGDVLIKSSSGYISDFNDVIQKISNNPFIVSAIPMIEGQVMVSANNMTSFAFVRGIRVADIKYKPLVANNLIDYLAPFDDEHLIIGYKLAYNLGLHDKHQNITLISSKGNYTAIGMIPRMKIFSISSSFKSDMYLYDESAIFITLEMAQKYFNLHDKVTVIEIMLKDSNVSDLIAQEIQDQLGHDYNVTDWKYNNASFFSVLKTERVVMFLILTLIIIVAAFNIVSSLIMLVKDKTKDIAILRTLGASQSSIGMIFLLCGCSVGVIGTILGLILGLSFALNIESIRLMLEKLSGNVIFDPIVYYLSSLPSDVKCNNVLQVVAFSIALSVLATIYPALKAAKQSPIDGLRYE